MSWSQPQGLSESCAAKTVSRVFTEVGQKALLDTFNEVRRTIAYGEEEGQPPAANMKKMVPSEPYQYVMLMIIGRPGLRSLQQ